MKIQLYFLAGILLAGMGCAGKGRMAETVAGTYYGYLPCGDCPGIRYELSLNPDFTYTEVVRYDGNNNVYVSGSRFSMTRDSLVLLRGMRGHEVINILEFSSGKLEMRPPAAKKSEQEAKQYLLTSEKPEAFEPNRKPAPEKINADALEGTWILESINGNPVKVPPGRQHPRLIFDTGARAVSGYGGCNQFHGNVTLSGNKLTTGSITATKMACLDTQDIENRFLGTLSGKTLEIKLDGASLALGDRENELKFVRGQ
jgi:copper homeostasis protein (lipoprotein)